MSDFESKKKLLVAESEVYRELLKLELQTFKVYTQRKKRQLTSPSTYMPWVMSGLPFLGRLFGRKKSGAPASGFKRIGSLILLGWKTYQRFGPMLRGRESSAQRSEPTRTAAEEYLSKRL